VTFRVGSIIRQEGWSKSPATSAAFVADGLV
jgi:hypothetical protein